MLEKFVASISANLKAHAAGLGAAFVLLQADLDQVHSFGAIDAKQWVAIVVAYLGIGAVVHVAPNTPKPEAVDAGVAYAALDEDIQHDDGTDD